MKIPAVKLWNFTFNFFCISGCGYQVQNIALSYFSYGSVTKNKYYSPTTVLHPDIHVCFRYIEDALDIDTIVLKYGYKPYKTAVQRHGWLDYVTIKDIFDHTPDFSIEECVVRDKTGNLAYVTTNCSIFQTTKYIQQQYVCYRIRTIEKKPLYLNNVLKSLYFDRTLGEIRYGGKLSKFLKTRITLSGNQNPYISRFYSPSYYKKADETAAIHVACQKFNNKFLGYPFDPRPCPNNGDEYQYFKCHDRCLTDKTIKYLNRKPFHCFHTKPEDIKILSESIMKNITAITMYVGWLRECDHSCHVMACEYSYCITSGHLKATRISRGEKHRSYVRIESTPHPDIYVTYVPSLPFLDFIIYIFSSLGTWFGLVIISCNPILLFKTQKVEYLTRYQTWTKGRSRKK